MGGRGIRLAVAGLCAVLIFEAGAIAPQSVANAAVEMPPAVAKELPPAVPTAPTELTALRTETSRTFDNHNGTLTAEFFTQPIHYRPAGQTSWQGLDTTFKPATSNGLLRRSTGAAVAVGLRPANAANGFLQLDAAPGSVAFRLLAPGAPGALAPATVAAAAPSVDGSVATYASVLPGVDLQVSAGPHGAKTFVVLRDPSAPTSFTFAVDAPGLTLRATRDGGAELRDGAGALVARLPRPYAVDSSANPARGSGAFGPATLAVGSVEGTPVVTIAADAAWLKTATYPVYLDPTVTFSSTAQSFDAFVSQAYPTQNFADYARPDSPYYHELWLGMDPGNSNNVNYDYLRFDLSSIADVSVESAQLRFYPYHQYYAAPTAVRTWVDRVNSSWSETGITWNVKPASTNLGYLDTVKATTAYFTATATVQSWVNGSLANNGFKLHQNGNNATYWKRLISSEQGGANVPALIVTYHQPSASTPAHNFANSRTLAWTYADPAGHAQSHFQVEVHTNKFFNALLTSSGTVASGTASWTIPAGVSLTSGTEYWWRVKVKDGAGWSSWASTSFVWDTAAPTGSVSINDGAASADTSTVKLSLTGLDPGTNLVYANDGRSLASVVGGCAALVCGSGWLAPRIGSDRAEGAVALIADGGGSTPTWHAATVDAATALRSTLAMDVKRDSSSGLTYVGLISDDNDSFRFMLTSSGDYLTQLHYTATSTPGSYTFVTLPSPLAFTPGIWYRLVITSTGPTYNLWWYPRASAQPDQPSLRQSGVYLLNPRLHLFQRSSTLAPTSLWLDDLKVTQSNAAVPFGTGITGVRFSADNVNWGDWQGYRDTLTYALAAGSGSRTVYAQFRDGLGNVSASVSDAISVAFGNLGRQRQHSVETWDLGAGDELAVNVATGNAVLTHPLATLPFRGDSLALSLTYNSQDSTDAGLGAGWRLSVQRRLTLNPDGSVTFIDADGARHVFSNPVVNGALTTYTRPAGLYASLVKDTTQASEFSLTYRDQRRDHFDIVGSEGLLVRAEDRHANGVDLACGAGSNLATITDPAGRQVSFTWDTAPTPDRLTAISDWAYVSGGVVQTSASGAPRSYRFFYDVGGSLIGWSDPLNTSGSCPTGGSHLTCLGYTSGLLTTVTKTQTLTTLSGGALGSTTRTLTTRLAYAGSRASYLRDAEQEALGGPPTTLTADQADRVVVARPTTTTTYGLLSAVDAYARVASAWRHLDPLTDIERRTAWDASFPTEPASVTDNYGALLGTPARMLTYTYLAGSLGNLATLVEPLTAAPATNRWTEYAYNANNDVTQLTVSADGSASLRSVTRYCYDSGPACAPANGLDLLAEVANYVDGSGGSGAGLDDNDTDVRTDYGYDAYGQRTDVTRHNRDAAGTLLDERHDRFTYDAYGNLTAEIVNLADGAVTAGDDLTPNPTTLARTDLTTSHTYDTAGNRVSSADPRRAILAATGSPAAHDYVTRWTYDALNQQLTETTPTTPGVAITQKTSSASYDELGLLRVATDLGGLTTGTQFDRAGRATQTYTPPAVGGGTWAVTQVAFDADGHPLTAKDARQSADASLGSTQFEYDALGRQVASAEAIGTAAEAWTLTAYDALDRRTRYVVGADPTTGLGQETTYGYDLAGRTTSTDDGFTCTTESFDYRDLSQSTVVGKTGNGCGGTGDYTVTHTHDGLARRTRDERGTNGTRTLDEVFDSAGNRLQSSPRTEDADGNLVTTTTSFTVNLLDQIVRENRADGSVAKTSYDAAGNAADQCVWNPGATLGDCLPAGTDPWPNPPAQATTSRADARNQRILLVDAGTNVTTTYAADHNYQVASTYQPLGAGRELQSLRRYDDRHRLIELTIQTCAADADHACTDAPVSVGRDLYAYDQTDSRTQVQEDNGSGTGLSDWRYCYDATGQLVSRNSGAACSPTSGDERYAYDEAGNRSQAIVGGITTNFTYDAEGRLTAVDGQAITHDAAGRIFTDGRWIYSYDGEGRLVEVCDSVCTGMSTRYFYTYDAEGHRTRIEVVSGYVSTITDVRYAGDRPVAELTDGVVTKTYVSDASGAIVSFTIPAGQPEAGTYLVTWNGHGDALNLLRLNGDGTTTLANSYRYATWGAPTTSTHNGIGDLGFRYLYVGQSGVQWDAGIGAYLMGARHYSPALGRFLQSDPAALEESSYAYTENNPISRADAGGGCWQTLAFAVTGVGAAPSAGAFALCIGALWVVGTVSSQAAVRSFNTQGCLWNCSTAQANRAYGTAAELLAAWGVARFIKGHVRFHVYFQTPLGGRYLDICVYRSAADPNTRALVCFEVKTGRSPYYLTTQWYKDNYIMGTYKFRIYLIRGAGRTGLQM